MVNASKAGYAVTSSDMFTAPVAGQTQVITVRIAKAVDVRFKVTDYSNFPLDVATLQLTFKGETKTYQPESLGGGEFIFRGLAASKNGKLIEYQATGSCGGYVTSSMNFSCNPEAQEQSFTLRLGIPYKPYHGGDFEWRTMVASQQVGENILSVTRLSLELQCERGTNGEITWTTIKSTVLITNYRVADMNTYQQYGGTPPVYYQIEIGKELFHPEARLLPNGVVLFSAAGTSFHGLQLQLPIG
jgi:hypothetical protein